MLKNGDQAALTASQIAAHLGVPAWNVTRELQLAKTQPHRLRGRKVLGEGVGRGGQWRVDRETYLQWLGIPREDRTNLAADGLPRLVTFEFAAGQLQTSPALMQTLIRQQRLPHIVFGRRRYLTHNQLAAIRVLLEKADDLPVRQPVPAGLVDPRTPG